MRFSTRINRPIYKTLSLLSLATLTTSTFHNDKQITVYWGQASEGGTQKPISYYCQSESVDVIVLAFVSEFGEKYASVKEYERLDDDDKYKTRHGDGDAADEDGAFILNLSSYCAFSNIANTYKCPSLVDDIKTCQKLGKKVLLSLGGEHVPNSKQTYGFSDEDEGTKFAAVLWDLFAESDLNSQRRPFGDAVVDGFDVDTENEDQIGYLSMIHELSEIAKDKGSKKYYFTSAPQCMFPDKSNSQLIDNFELDYIFVQFYNNDCQLNKGDVFNFQEWHDHLEKLGHDKTKLFVGLPSSASAAVMGFIQDETEVTAKIQEIENDKDLSKHFGGLMFWDASKGFHPSDRDSMEKSYIYNVWSKLTSGEDQEVISSPNNNSSSTTNSSSGLESSGANSHDSSGNGGRPSPYFNSSGRVNSKNPGAVVSGMSQYQWTALITFALFLAGII